MTKRWILLTKGFIIIAATFLLVYGLVASKSFLAPIVVSMILALIILPFSRKIESKLISKAVSSFISTLLLFVFSLLFLTLCSMQVQSFFSKWPSIKAAMAPEVAKFKTFLFSHTFIDEGALNRYYPSEPLPMLLDQVSAGSRAVGFLMQSLNFIGTYLLVFVYVFFLLNYRSHFKNFLLNIFGNRKKVKKLTEESADVVQGYLIGRLILMGILAVLYSVGLGISGVENFILVGIIAALLTLIPWIGNIIGLGMAMVFGYLTSGNIDVLWGVVITFTVSQLLESYVLQPYIVGDKVGLHPFFVILFVIFGGTTWGLIGMVLAIPVMAIITVLLQNIEPLKPFGTLFSKPRNN